MPIASLEGWEDIVEQTLASTAELSDAELISAVRAGDTHAYGQLFERHRFAAERMARQIARGSDVDDLVAESFSRVMVLLQDGRGPDEAFRAYLLTSIRRLHIDRVRASNKVWSTAHEADLDRAVEFIDPAEMKFEHGAAAVAFASLPERWRLVLWHLDVEGQKPAEVAPLLGMSANSVSALAYRAREGLRQAYLQGHLAPTLHASCRRTTGMLGAHVRKGLSARDAAKVEAHLDDCTRCTGLYLELREINSNLSGVLGPSLLGPAFAGYVAAGAGVAALGAGAATVIGVKLVTGGAVKLVVVPAKVIGGAVAGAGTQGVVAAAVVTGVATAGTVAVTTDIGRAPADRPAAVAPSFTGAPSLAAPASTSDQATPATQEAEPEAAAPTPTVAPTLEPEPSPSPSASTEPEPEPSPTSETTEPLTDPEPSPPVAVEEPIVPTDYGIGALTITNDDNLLQRRFTVPVTAVNTGRSADQVVTVTMRFTRPVQFRGVVSPGWACGDATVDRSLSVLTCSTTLPAGEGTTFVVKARGIRPDGTVTVSSPGDPAPANDSAPFTAGAYLLLL
ncbi:sigma-70 family RNA polymerase sigma factor [Aeromicrobium fastidiosum]|nr:sigma-70 family RNA polymerase sigma factor [Aeromicrobium fastidiosum]